MLPEERIRVLIFLASVAAVYVFAAGSLIRLAIARFGSGPRPIKAQKWFGAVVCGAALIGIGCLVYGYFVEPYRLTVRKVEIRTSKLRPDTASIRIAQISDLHSDSTPRLEEKLPQILAEQKPDIIVYTGDSINSPEGLPVFRNCLTKISKIAPTYVVKGNWDVWYWSKQDLFGDIDVKELNGTSEKVDIRGSEIWLAGMPVDKGGKVAELLEPLPKDKFSVFLYHYPDEIENVANYGVDLYCSGHTHGGQIALPLYGALVTFSKYGKRFEG